MIKSSLNSRHKRIRFFFYIIFFLAVSVISLDIYCSIVLNDKLDEAKRAVASVREFSFQYHFAYFNIFRGATIAGFELDSQGETLFSARRFDLGFDLLSLSRKRLNIKNVYFRKARLALDRVSDLSALATELSKKMDKTVGFYETIYFNGADLALGDAAAADIQGYVSFVKGNLFISRGVLSVRRIWLPAFSEVDFFKGSSFYKPFDYAFEAESHENNFLISRLELSNPTLKFSGSGRIEGVLPAARIIFEMNSDNIIFDDFPVLNDERFQSRGVVDASLKLSGAANDLGVLINLRIANAHFSLFDSFNFEKVNGTAVLSRDHLVGQDFSLVANGMPFKADFAIDNKTVPHVRMQLSSQTASAVSLASFVLDLNADWADNELLGEIKSRLRYPLGATTNTLDFGLKNFRLGFEDNLFIEAETLEAALTVTRNEKNKEIKIFDKAVALEHVFSVVRKEENGLILDNLKSSCYGGTLEGQVNFVILNDRLDVKGEAHVRSADLEEFFKRSHTDARPILGKVEGDLRFDTSLPDMFKGQVFITNGTIEQNPLLNAVSDFLGVASLKKLNFDDLSLFFTGGRGDYTSQVKLSSPRVNGLLDGKVSSYDNMDGFLNISLATELLKESKSFKKILIYIKHDEPSVIFPFKISSYINSPRVLWLKNEFKEKLQNLLPEGNKRFLQRSVNNMVEKMEEE